MWLIRWYRAPEALLKVHLPKLLFVLLVSDVRSSGRDLSVHNLTN